jgi:hypothetical protein
MHPETAMTEAAGGTVVRSEDWLWWMNFDRSICMLFSRPYASFCS